MKKIFFKKLIDKIINTRIDDYYINYYLIQKNKKMANYKPNNVNNIIKVYNPIFLNSRSKTYKYSIKLVKRSFELVNKIKFK